MAENELEPPLLGVSWDGTGYGLDGTIWGGEFFWVTSDDFERVGHFRPFRLPGGDKAVREPRRAALGLLYEILGEAVFQRSDLHPVAAFSRAELATLRRMLESNVNAPLTSSAGRLFDAVASLVGIRQVARFEGQAAMELEFALPASATSEGYEIVFLPTRVDGPEYPLVLDSEGMVREILNDLGRQSSAAQIAARFHNALAEAIVAVAARVGEPRVLLTGGCFQNRYLTERAVQRLQEAGFRPYWHQRIPPNDGGIALGQVVAALRQNG